MSWRSSHALSLALAGTLIALTLSACGRNAPNSPAPTEETFTLTSNPLPIVHGPATAAPVAQRAFAVASPNDSGPSRGCPSDSTDLIFGCAGWAHGDSLVQMGACRYRLRVPPGAVQGNVFVMLRYFASSWVEVRVSTYGDSLRMPLEVEMDLSGTNVDPTSPNYDQSAPRAFAYDDVADRWTRLPATYDATTKRLVTQVPAAGRVAIGGKAGW